GFIPAVADVEFPPEVVFLLFIPPLVFLGAYRTPWRDFKSNLRPISGMDRFPIQHRCHQGAVDERLERPTSESTTRGSGPVLVFFVLAGLYEGWSLPLAVILVVPMCVLCALAGVAVRGLDDNLFTQTGFVVLIGLACKNAILIVEFARDRQLEGASVFDA